MRKKTFNVNTFDFDLEAIYRNLCGIDLLIILLMTLYGTEVSLWMCTMKICKTKKNLTV